MGGRSTNRGPCSLGGLESTTLLRRYREKRRIFIPRASVLPTSLSAPALLVQCTENVLHTYMPTFRRKPADLSAAAAISLCPLDNEASTISSSGAGQANQDTPAHLSAGIAIEACGNARVYQGSSLEIDRTGEPGSA